MEKIYIVFILKILIYICIYILINILLNIVCKLKKGEILIPEDKFSKKN